MIEIVSRKPGTARACRPQPADHEQDLDRRRCDTQDGQVDDEQQPCPDRDRCREIDEDQAEVPRSKHNGNGLRDAPVRKRTGGDECRDHCHCGDQGLRYPGRRLYLSRSPRARRLSNAGQ